MREPSGACRSPVRRQSPCETARDRRVLRAAQRGDRRARRRVVACHLDLVRATASRYRGLGVPLDDLIQEGSLGVLEAIDRHDPDRGDFESYARFRARRAIRNALTNQARLVRLPKQIVERRRALAMAADRLTEAASGKPPTVDELAAETGLSPASVDRASRAAVGTVSLEEAVLADGTPREGLVADPAARDPLLQTLDREEARLVRRAVSELGGRQRQVISHHYGFGCQARPLSEVADELHMSQQRTRAVERQALHRLRDSLELAGVEP